MIYSYIYIMYFMLCDKSEQIIPLRISWRLWKTENRNVSQNSGRL